MTFSSIISRVILQLCYNYGINSTFGGVFYGYSSFWRYKIALFTGEIVPITDNGDYFSFFFLGCIA